MKQPCSHCECTFESRGGSRPHHEAQGLPLPSWIVLEVIPSFPPIFRNEIHKQMNLFKLRCHCGWLIQ
jgi:hypothetical protein